MLLSINKLLQGVKQMKSVLETCKPRKSIIQGTFNPEVFTAALGPVIEYYRGNAANIDSVYTDAEVFFKEATYPTDGLKNTVNNIFKRISGDMTVPSVQRMETAFGGGKTHTLIACVHIANRGKEIADTVANIIEAQYLPEPGEVKVVGIAGDEIDLYKTKGEKIIPYTLWGDIALQIGGKELYDKVKADAESYAAPGSTYFKTVLAERKVLIMFDELAQYAARFETYKPGQGSNQVAAFLMSLFGYTRNNSGISVVLTLAGANDAFARETGNLTKLLNNISDEELNIDQATAIAEHSVKTISSVISRDATVVTPVQANEISAVLAKRLFDDINKNEANITMKAYVAMYDKNKAMLPEAATNLLFRDRLVAHYPFHPTLIDFLNNKLAVAENFQGTRGVLRVLAMTIRSIWNHRNDIALIHVSDIDMKNSGIVDEILGKTQSSDLRQVLNADIGSVDTHSLSGGLSNAQLADQRNPHPEGVRLYENTWKDVFLNSLVGRADMKTSKVFGVSEQDAIFQVATPVVAPSQVRTALEEIVNSAFYLRYENGKYFAHLDPTINSVLARIRSTVTAKQIETKIKTVANDLVEANNIFNVVHNVFGPEDLDDKSEKPVVAVVGISAGEINLEDIYKYTGANVPRRRQNLILLLVPKTVTVKGYVSDSLFKDDTVAATEKNNVELIARQVIAFQTLDKDPQGQGISKNVLQNSDFRERYSERGLALRTAVGELYSTLYFAGPNGFVKADLHSASGDNGAAILSQVRACLENAEELITSDTKFGGPLLEKIGNDYFFKQTDKIKIKDLLDNFYNIRTWPMLADKMVLETILRNGISAGTWVAYKMSDDPADDRPSVLYSDKEPVPLDVTLITSDLSVMSFAGAKTRGWLTADRPTNEEIKKKIKETLINS